MKTESFFDRDSRWTSRSGNRQPEGSKTSPSCPITRYASFAVITSEVPKSPSEAKDRRRQGT